MEPSEFKASKAFVLKGSVFTLSVIQLLTADNSFFANQLSQSNTSFFKNAPVLIDISQLSPDAEIDFTFINKKLRDCDFIPIAVIGGTEEQQQNALAKDLAVLPSTIKKPDKTKSVVTTKIITEQVHSGQQVFAPDSDLVVIAKVNPGAELVADGSIHVYGPLLGKALAGANGNKLARIFCNSLQAELVSIAGVYLSHKDIKTSKSKPAQIYLANDKIKIEPLLNNSTKL